MMSKNKSQYIGFDDKWFMTIGVLALALLITFLFNSRFYSGIEFFFSYLISLLFTLANWSAMRFAMIQLRKQYPNLAQSLKRNLIFLPLIVVIVMTINQVGDFLLKIVFGPQYNSNSVSGTVIIILISIMMMSIYEAIYYFDKLKLFIVKEEQTRQVLTESKLDALRNQARPHFLFNSLNTLRDIIDSEPKKEAITFVDQLSDVYRFILDTGQANTVPLREEIAFAKSYLHIQSERFGQNLIVNWNISEVSKGLTIIPMSLQLLLENAIKHNVISRSKPLQIDIKSDQKSISVTNNLQPKSTTLNSTKLGLNNIHKRYEIIGDRLPIVNQTSDSFIVSLPLDLN